MEKGIIENLRHILPDIIPLVEEQSDMRMNFDRQADVLYISFRPSQKADDSQIVQENIIVRKKDNSIIGITVLHYRQQYS